MWLYWCLLSTIISGFTSIALKKCSNNDSKQIAIAGLLLYHLLMIIVSLIAYPQFLTQLNIIDFVKMLPGILLQSAGFYCAIASVKYGKISITSSIKRARVVITFLLTMRALIRAQKEKRFFILGVLYFLTVHLAF